MCLRVCFGTSITELIAVHILLNELHSYICVNPRVCVGPGILKHELDSSYTNVKVSARLI